MKKNGNGKIKIAVLQEQMKNIKENDLVHIREDIASLKTSFDVFKDKFEEKIDAMKWQLAKLIGGIIVLGVAVNIIINLLKK